MIRMLEDKYGFIELLEWLDITEKISLFIGDEAGVFDGWEMLTILVKKIQIDGYSGYIGILWPIKMDYSFNIAALKQVL
jgi:transcriptional regulator of heat shock response